jgi:hypothetical protein
VRQQLFDLSGQPIYGEWPGGARPKACRLDHPVAFHAAQLGAYRVGGLTERQGQLVSRHHSFL